VKSTEVGPVLARGPNRLAAATTEVGQATQPIAEILISMTLKTVGAAVGTARRAEVAAAAAQVVGQAGANIPTRNQVGTL